MSVVIDADMADAKRSYDQDFDVDAEAAVDPEEEVGPAKMCIASWVVIPIKV